MLDNILAAVTDRINDKIKRNMSHYGMGSLRSASTENSCNGETSEVRRNIQDDWQRRDDILLLTTAIKRLVDFLNQFGNLIMIIFIIYFILLHFRIVMSLSFINIK